MRRKRFDKALLQELADSIKGTQGVIQPIVLRPHPKPTPLVKYEIVAGERRWVGSGMAAFDSILGVVRDLDDEQVLEIQLVENLQREGLHEMEEAEGYQELMKLKKLTADEVGDKIGKSRRYVFNRLKLLDLCPGARQAFYAGEINASVALYLARIPVPELQLEALTEVGGDKYQEGAMSAREALDLIQRRYMLALKDAPFDVKAIYFMSGPNAAKPIAGNCADCPKRTGNQKDLFSDIKSENVCTDPKCFDDKREAAKRLLMEEAKEKGTTVITGKQAQKIFPYSSTTHTGSSEFATADTDTSDYGSYRSWGKILGKHLPAPLLVEHEASGTLVPVYRTADLKKAAKDAGHKVVSRSERMGGPSKAAQLKQKIDATARVRILGAIRVANRTRQFDIEDARLVALQLWGRLGFDTQKRLVDVLNAENNIPRAKGGGHDYVHDFEEKIAALDAAQLGVLMLDMVLIGECTHWGAAEDLMATAKRLKVDAAKITAETKAEFDALEKAKKPAAKTAKK